MPNINTVREMPPKKKVTKKKSPRLSEEDDNMNELLDVHYNPDIISGLIAELAQSLDVKCSQIQKDSDFMATSIQQDFNLEMIKIPTQVKQMSIKRFKEEFGFSLEAVTKGAIGGGYLQPKSNYRTDHSFGGHSSRSNQMVMQTPSMKSGPVRNPREGEIMVSQNGSPLGEFTTVKKAPRQGGLTDNFVPQTPGVFVPLKNGTVLDVETDDIENLPQDVKAEALQKMQDVMNNMQSLMAKLSQPSKV